MRRHHRLLAAWRFNFNLPAPWTEVEVEPPPAEAGGVPADVRRSLG